MGLGKDVFMRLLVLEDDTTVLEVLRRDLSALGYVLSSAPSVQAAQVALRAETFDVAVCATFSFDDVGLQGKNERD